MAQQDIVEKLLEDYPDVFADIFNVLLFKKELIKPEELLDSKVKSQYKADDTKIHEIERDVAKVWKEKVTLALVGIENQTTVDKFMPLRILAYDGASYRSQLITKENESVKELYPVVTIVLYFGKTAWNQPKSLKDTLKKFTTIPPELDPYVNDYNIYVFDIPRLSNEEVKKFKSDFQLVADFFVQTKNGTYVPSKQKIQHKDSVLKFLSVFSNTEDFDKIVETRKVKEVTDMCEVIERMKAEERIKNTIRNLKNLMLSMDLNLQQAMDAFRLNAEEQEKCRELIEKM